MGINQVQQFVAERGKPDVVSLSEDTHIFHFGQQGFWEDSPILFVNRNGHHFRCIDQGDGSWLFAKTWTGVFETKAWEVEANLKRTDPAKLINLCGIGPQARRGIQFETLCLLPRETTQNGRWAVWRQHMLRVYFDKGAGTFTITLPDGTQKMFRGKLWESHDAALWCASVLANQKPTIVAPTANQGPLTDKQSASLENNPLFGLF